MSDYKKRKQQYDHLTQDEKIYIFTHPWHADEIERNAQKALAEAIHRFGAGSAHNGAGDAFRHCYWSALLSRDIGEANALQFTTAHENFPLNPVPEKDMDLWNNRIGIAIGVANPKATDTTLAIACYGAYMSGKLKVLHP